MGYDNECIVNIQSLAGEYFCPVCRTLVYPNEALQSQCTHLYCKPCLAYVVATTHACPYDGFLVTEADSKPLVESNKELGETIGKVAVYCLFHRSGCQWQGTLAESTAHCAGCNYGNSPVVCNRCGTQIVHRQVQEHAQICPGIQPQAQPQQVENQQAQASSFPNQSSADAAATSAASTGTVATTAPSADAVHSATVSSASASVPAAASATSGPAQAQAQGGAVVYPQAPAQGQTPEQCYQQQQQLQYQQYYQQYPGYDPYQQQYQQQYAQYQQQPGYPQHVQPPMQAAAPQHVQPQPYLQPQPQAQPQLQAVQPQVQQPHHPQPQPHLPAQVPPMQAPQPQQMPPPQQLYPHSQPQAHLPPHGHVAGQAYPQPQPHATHARPPQLPGPPLQHQQQPMPPPQQLQQQMPHPHPHPQHGPRPQHPPSQPQKPPTQMQPQPQPHSHAPPVPQMQSSNPPAHAVSGFQSYPQSNPGIQQQQRPMQMHHPLQQGIPTQQHVPPQGQFPHQQPSQMRPPHSQMPMPAQQPLGMPPPLGPPPNLYPPQQVQHLAHQSVQQAYQQPGLPHQQIHAQQPMRPQGAPYMQQPVPGHPHHQGLLPNQSHSRPMMQQPGPQSPGAAHNKFMQLGMTQQSPNQSSVGKSTSLLASSEQQSQHPHSGSHGGQFSGPKQGASTPDKVSQIPPEATKSGENSKHMGDEGKGTVETEKDSQVEKENKVLSESLVKEENMGQPLLKQVKEEEGANILSEFQGQDNKPDDKSGSVKGDEAHSVLEGTPMVQNQPGSDKVMHGESQNIERPSLSSVTGNPMHPAQHLPPPGVLDRGQVQKQPTQENIHPVQGGANPHPGFNERNPTHFPQQYTGPDDRRGMPPGGPQQQQIPYGHPPHMPDPTIMLQRPAPPDRMLPQPMPQSSQERRFPEPPPHQVHMQGQTVPPSHMRPPGHNASDAFAHQGTPAVPQEPFWPPPHAGVPAQNLPPPPGRGPGLHGFPPKGFEQQAMGPAQGQTHLMPPPHAGGARPPPGDPSPWPVMGGPPPGDPSSRIVGGPPFTPSDRVEVETHGIKRPGAYDGRQLEPHRPLLSDGALYGQPNVLKNNGMLNNAPVGGMHEDRFRPMPEERFKPFHEEGYKAHPDEHFRPPMLDPGRHIADRREFEEDLKQFPRPAYLDGDGPRFDGYLSSSRPLDRMAGVNVPPSSRPLPNIGSSEFHPDIGDRDRPILFHDHLVRKHDGPIAHPDRSNLVSEFGRHRLDNLPPLRSPGHFGGEFPDRLPGHLRRGMDGHGPLGHSLPSDLRGSETMDSQNLPSFSRGGSFGGFRSHVGIGELGGPGNMPLHLRGSREGDMDPFEQSRKRKMGNMVRCLICKIDCDTVEGLEVHSQTREHQKMAMDVVLSIKKDNAKKHKLTADNATSFEGANKPRKAGFEKRGNRQ